MGSSWTVCRQTGNYPETGFWETSKPSGVFFGARLQVTLGRVDRFRSQMNRPLACAHELTACARMNSRPRTTPRSEPVADQRARRGLQEEHAGDVVNRVHRLALLAQIHTCPRLPAILVDLKQYVAVSIGSASQHEN